MIKDNREGAKRLYEVVEKQDQHAITNYFQTRFNATPRLGNQELMLSAVQDHLTITYETEKTQRIKQIGEMCKQLIDSTILANSNNPNRSNRLIEFVQNQQFDFENTSSSEIDLLVSERFASIEQKLMETLGTIRDQIDTNHPMMDTFVRALFSSSYAKHFKIGNCSEISYVIFTHLLAEKEIKKLDLYELEGGDHVLCVGNRKKKSDSSDYTTWGKDCWIFDFWSDEVNVFPARDITEKLKNFQGSLDLNYHPNTEPFDPNKHTLSLVVSNIYTSNDFSEIVLAKEDPQTIDWYLGKLKEFDQVQSDTMKIAIAQEIVAADLKVCHEDNFDAIETLKSQFKFYLDPSCIELYNLNPETKPQKSVFEDLELNERIFENFISSLDVDLLVKIAESFEKKDPQAQLLLDQLSYSLQEAIQNYLDAFGNEPEEKADAVYQLLLDKAHFAKENGKSDIALKLLNKLPPELLDDVEKTQ